MGREEKSQMEERLKGRYSTEPSRRAFSSCLVKNARYVRVELLHPQMNTRVDGMGGRVDGQTHTKTWRSIDQQHPEKLRANNVAPCHIQADLCWEEML